LIFNCKQCGIESEWHERGRMKKFCSQKCAIIFHKNKNMNRMPYKSSWVYTGFVKVPERVFTTPLDRYMDSATLIEMKRLEVDEA
tara:strand:- start:53 stop:307 length:255 start_codon:yes stop_codon:yes gene_type:complete